MILIDPHFGSGYLPMGWPWGGVFDVKGWGPKKFGFPSKLRETKLFGRISWDLCRDIPEVPEKFAKKKFAFNVWPLAMGVYAFDEVGQQAVTDI